MAKRKNQARRARLDERAAQIRAQADADRRRTYIVVAVFAVLIIGGAGLLYFLTNPPDFGPHPAAAGAGKPVGAVQTIEDEGRGHVQAPQRVTYKHQPPSSGAHYNNPPQGPLPWTAYKDEQLPETWVHNLEHGGVVLVYRCTGSECDQMYKLAQAIASSHPKEPTFNEVKFVSAPYLNMTPKAAMLAWDHEQDFTGVPSVNDATSFYNQFVDKGPETAQ